MRVKCTECGHEFDTEYSEPLFEDRWYELLAPGARKICQEKGLTFSPEKFRELLRDETVQFFIEADEYSVLRRTIEERMQ